MGCSLTGFKFLLRFKTAGDIVDIVGKDGHEVGCFLIVRTERAGSQSVFNFGLAFLHGGKDSGIAVMLELHEAAGDDRWENIARLIAHIRGHAGNNLTVIIRFLLFLLIQLFGLVIKTIRGLEIVQRIAIDAGGVTDDAAAFTDFGCCHI